MPAPSAEPVTAGDLLTLEELGDLRRTSAVLGRLIELTLGALLLAACGGVPAPAAETQDEQAARCARSGGWWIPGTSTDGHCEFRRR